MSDDFIKTIATNRAKELFTKEFFNICTDSWYLDEKFRFESFKVGKDQRKPTEEESDKYMGWLQLYKDNYQDNYFSIENAVCSYSQIIDEIRDIVEQIEEYKKRYKDFECPVDITLKLKQVGNYFVNIHNELLPIYNAKVKDAE